MATPYETLYQKYLKEYEAKQNESIVASDAVYDSKIKTIEDTYNQNINKAKQEYEDDYRANAVQKKVNEFYIAEDMANMGLTNSGLSRMQVTANNLSYANNKAKLDRQRQSMVDSLTMEMTNLISSAKTEKLSAAQGIRDSYTELAAENASEAYKAELEAEAEQTKAYYSYLEKQAKAQEEDNYIIKANGANLSRNFVGSLKDNGVTVRYNSNGTTTYVDTRSGKSTTMDSSINPYTGTRNDDVDVGFFKNNPYQPNNIKGVTLKDSTAKMEINGSTQRVWTTNNKDYYLWDGSKNKYIKLNEAEKKKIGVS